MIKLVEIKKVFHAGKPNEFAAIRGISLALEDGRATALKGPSGSGKTTLLSLIGCMARPTEGRIWLGEREITSLPERFLTGIRRRTFGFIFQQPNLIPGLSALENTLVPALPLGEPYGVLRRRGLGLLERLQVGSKAPSPVQWLSGGEAQRVTIARALINDPAFIIADEPTAHLDTALTLDLLEILAELKQDGKTLLISSHDPLVYESPVVDRVIKLRDGKVEGEGSPGEKQVACLAEIRNPKSETNSNDQNPNDRNVPFSTARRSG